MLCLTCLYCFTENEQEYGAGFSTSISKRLFIGCEKNKNGILNVTAHEMGHVLGIEEEQYNNKNLLMYWDYLDNSYPTMITKEEWDLVNN